MKLKNELTTPEETRIIAVGRGPNIGDKPMIIGTVVFGCKPGNKPSTTPKAMPIASERNTNNIIKKDFLLE